MPNLMINAAFKDLAVGAFENGLQKLNGIPQWNDDSDELDGPFFLGFPGVNGWGEGLLVASLLKRYAITNNRRIAVFAQSQVCSILKNDCSFKAHAVTGFDEAKSRGARSPLAILKAALTGDLLRLPFKEIETTTTATFSAEPACQIGIAWASISNGHSIHEKTIPLPDFLGIFHNRTGDCHVISFQRHLSDDDRERLRERLGSRFSVVSADMLNKEDDQTEVVNEILRLDCMVTISTTTAHIAACLGIPVIVLAARRAGPQWFWRAQVEHGKPVYDSVTVILGGEDGKWWENCVPKAQQLLLTFLGDLPKI